MNKKKSKKHNKKKNIKKQNHSKFLHDGIIIDVPYDEVIRKDISIIKEAIDRLPQNNSNKPTIFIEFFDIPSDAVECNPGAIVLKLYEYLYVAISKYPQILYHMVHSQKFDPKDISNAATIVDFYSDYYCTVPGCRDYMHSCTETKFECDNYKFFVSYNSDSCTVEIICEKLE